jgi:ribosomal protein S19
LNEKYYDKYFIKKKKYKIKYKNNIISPIFINKKIDIYNGKFYQSINVISSMVGYKFGEFIQVKTSYNYIHLKKSKKKNKKKSK